MLHIEWESRLEDSVREFKRLAATGAVLAAVAKIGEALVAIPPASLESAVGTIRPVLTTAVLQAASDESAALVRRGLGVLRVGTEFGWEEIVLLLTWRVQIGLVGYVMMVMAHESMAAELLDEFDAGLDILRRSRENEAAYASAVASIRRNWGGSILDSRLLGHHTE